MEENFLKPLQISLIYCENKILVFLDILCLLVIFLTAFFFSRDYFLFKSFLAKLVFKNLVFILENSFSNIRVSRSCFLDDFFMSSESSGWNFPSRCHVFEGFFSAQFWTLPQEDLLRELLSRAVYQVVLLFCLYLVSLVLQRSKSLFTLDL